MEVSFAFDDDVDLMMEDKDEEIGENIQDSLSHVKLQPELLVCRTLDEIKTYSSTLVNSVLQIVSQNISISNAQLSNTPNFNP